MALPNGADIFGIGLPAITTQQVQQWAGGPFGGMDNKQVCTAVVNNVAVLMQENCAAYLAGPAIIDEQTKAVANFNTLYTWMVNVLQTRGEDGARAIKERQPGGIYDDALYNLKPIEQDTRMSGTISGAIAGVSSTVEQTGARVGLSPSLSWIALALALAVASLLVWKLSKGA